MTRRCAACACGDLTLTTVGEPDLVALCSCRQCQRRTGSVYSAHAFFPQSAVKVAGEHTAFRRVGDSGRFVTFHFCPRCGSTMFWLADARPALLGIAMGGFADPDFPAPQSGIWAIGRADWVLWPESIPTYPSGTPAAFSQEPTIPASVGEGS